MAHFAKIDENNIVTEVLVISQQMVDTGLWGTPASFVQCSYNTRGGIYYIPDTSTPDPDQSKAFRKNYPGIGWTWLPDGPEGGGFCPEKPFPSWVLNPNTYMWDAPVPMPIPNSPPYYHWDEATLSWVLDDPQPTQLDERMVTTVL